MTNLRTDGYVKLVFGLILIITLKHPSEG